MGKKQGKPSRDGSPSHWPTWAALRALTDSLPLALLLTNPAGAPLLASGRFRADLGEPPAAGWLALVDPSDRPHAESLWLAAGAGRAPREAPLTLRGLGGAFPALVRIAPIEGEERLLGWAIALSEVAPDLTGDLAEVRAQLARAEARRREAEHLLAEGETRWADGEAKLALAEGRRREAEARFAEVEARLTQASVRLREAEMRGEAAERGFRARLEALPPMIWTAGPDGIPDLHNGSWRDFTGARPEDDWLRLVHPEDRARLLGLWGHAVAGGKPFEAQHRLRYRDGTYRRVLTRARPAWDERGAILSWMGTCTDLGGADPLGQAEERGSVGSEGSEAMQEVTPAPVEPQTSKAALAPALEMAAEPSERSLPESGNEAPPTRRPDGDRPLAVVPPDPAGAAPLQDEEELDRLAGRLRSGPLRQSLARWRVERRGAPVPGFAGWDEAATGASGHVVIEIDEAGVPFRLRVVCAPDETPLLRALATPAGGGGRGWRRCAASGRPAHDYAQVGLGPRESHSLERLLLPFSASGLRVDRLVLLMATDDAEHGVRLASLAS